MKLKSLLLMAAVVFPLAGKSWAGSDLANLVSADNAFSFKLLKQLAPEQSHGTIFVSPYSAATALQMAANGAAGKTRSEMELALGITGLTPEKRNAECKAVAALLASADTNLILTTANALWYRQESSILPGFLAANQDIFGSVVKPLDFHNVPAAEAAINQWASDQTHGRITGIANGAIDPDNTDLVLANAIYFKGKWVAPFNKEATKPRAFHPASGAEQMKDMMEKTDKYSYRMGMGYQAVRLPYMGGEVAMYLFLPDAGSSPEKILQVMNGDRWRRVTVPGFKDQKKFHLVLPKFKLEQTLELNAPLKELGMKTAFGHDADFSKMFGDRHSISAVRQKSFVQVDEEGTEAAAVTTIQFESLAVRAPEPPPIEMIVDRPFLFAIVDARSGLILFLGLVNELGD